MDNDSILLAGMVDEVASAIDLISRSAPEQDDDETAMPLVVDQVEALRTQLSALTKRVERLEGAYRSR